MAISVLKTSFVAILAGGIAAPPLSPVAPPTPAPQVRDGEATPAACRELGIEIEGPGSGDGRMLTRQATGGLVGHAPPPPPPPSPPPPPPPQIAPTVKEDRVEYTAPPMVMPNTTVSEVVASGQRIPRPLPPGPQYDPDSERYPDATPNPVRRVADEPVSTFSIDVDTASYSNVRRFLGDGQAVPRDSVRVEELINYFTYGYDRPSRREEPFAVSTALTESPFNEGRQILRVGVQGYELPESQRLPLNLTFLVDVSGSMGGPDRLGLAQRSMNLIIDRMRPQDSAAITYYASGAGTVLTATPGTDKLRLRCAVAGLGAGGGTAGAQGLANAYDAAQARFSEDRVNRVLLFTDGDFNLGVTSDQRLEDFVERKRETGIYLSIYGVGRGNYQDARMQLLAQNGNGTAAYLGDYDDARRQFGPMFDRGAFPIADDVKIQVEFNPSQVSEYRLIGYETRLLNEADFTNDRIDAGEVGSGASVTALYEITPAGGASQIPDRRYDQNRTRPAPADASGELAFVRLRYKLPGRDSSVEMNRPVQPGARPADADTRWALAVTGFGQRLRADPWSGDRYGWEQILADAQGSRGDDPYGDRAEFVQLVRAASGQRASGQP